MAQSGVEIAAQDILVESSRPKLEGASIERWTSGEPTIELSTNVTVAPAELRAVLNVSLEGRGVDFQLDEVVRRAYATLPAGAELMYGSASVARTTSGRLSVQAQPTK